MPYLNDVHEFFDISYPLVRVSRNPSVLLAYKSEGIGIKAPYRNVGGSTASSPIHNGNRPGVVLVGPVPRQDSFHEYVEMLLLKQKAGS